MYTIKELRGWWEVPAIAHFFSLFKSCFQLTDFTIEELEDALLEDGLDDKSTTFTSRLLTELLQGCYNNPNISVTTYHDALITIMKKRWEDEDGRINPLSSINADFHSLPTQLKVQIIHRLTEYRLDAQDVANKLAGLNPSDLRLEPLGVDHNGSRYWYFFGVRLYKETPTLKSRKRKLDSIKEASDDALDPEISDFSSFFNKNHVKCKKRKKKKHRKGKKGKELKNGALSPFHGLSENIWEVVCYNINDWKDLAASLEGATSRKEEALRQLIIDNFLPNLPKIVEDMEKQQIHKLQEDHPRRSSCRLLAKKLHEEEDTDQSRVMLVEDQEEQEERRRELEQLRLTSDFERMVQVEIDRWRKLKHQEFVKKQEDDRRLRLEQGLPPEPQSSSDEEFVIPKEGKSPPQRNGPNKELPVVVKRKGRLNRSKKVVKSATSGPPRAQKSKPNDIIIDEEEVGDKFDRVVGDLESVAMMETWKLLDDHPDAWPFSKPVEEWYAPGYHNIIKRPMDLSTIEQKLQHKKYKNVVQFKDDITLMFNNCRLYNGPDNEYTQVANVLDEVFKRNLLSKLNNSKVEKKTSRKTTNNEVLIDEEESQEKTKLFDEDQESDDPDSSSSDEFAPPGVSKALLKKKRLEVAKALGVIKDKPKDKTNPRMNNGSLRRSSADVATRRRSTNEDKTPGRKASMKRERIKVSSRGRRLSTQKIQNEVSDSGSEDEASPASKQRSRGGRLRRGRSDPPAKDPPPNNASKSESSESEMSEDAEITPKKEEEETGDVVDNNTDAMSTDHEKDEKSLIPLAEEEKIQQEDQTVDKVPVRDADTSSSSSRASSRSPSLEKFEKLEEDAKSKPQVMWSLDYLASQARVLEEQHRKLEASSSTSKPDPLHKSSVETSRKMSSPLAPDVAKQPTHSDAKKSPSSLVPMKRRNSNIPTDPLHPVDEKYFKQKRVTPSGEDDPYSFNDEDSPAGLFANKAPIVPEKPTAPPESPHHHDNHQFSHPRRSIPAFSPSQRETIKNVPEPRNLEQSPIVSTIVESSPRSHPTPVTPHDNPPTPMGPPSVSSNPQTPHYVPQSDNTRSPVIPKPLTPQMNPVTPTSTPASGQQRTPRPSPQTNIKSPLMYQPSPVAKQQDEPRFNSDTHEKRVSQPSPQNPHTHNRVPTYNPQVTPKNPDPPRRHSGGANWFDQGQRATEGSYRNPTAPSRTPQHCSYQNPPPPPTTSNRRGSVISNQEQSLSYTQESNAPVLLQNPSMANFGMNPRSLSQPNQENQQNSSRPNNQHRKPSISNQGSSSSSYGSKSSSHSTVTSQSVPQHPHPQQSYHTTSSGQAPQPQGSSSQQASGSKQRTQSTDSINKHRNNNSQVASSNNNSQSGRRQSSGNAVQQYQKNANDYHGYHIPPTPAPTPRDARTPVYSPHNQNGLLSASGANNNAALLHQDLTASATLRALQQQQHKSDRPSHAAMFHHYAAQQGAVAAANEQYNRLASAHRATPQHPLAGVYHHHHQNASTSSAQHAAAHLSAPWLQASPATGYPSNLLAPPHMDPVYQLIQQSGMHGHGQYQMYPNPVVQQLTQQHLQHHHMLPKY